MTDNSRFMAAVDGLQRGDPAAPAAMEALARARNPDALAIVAEFRLHGMHGRRNLAEALRLFAAAAEHGHVDAARTRAYLTNAGIGRKAHPELARNLLRKLAPTDRFSEVQLALLPHLTCAKRLGEIEPQIVSADPYIAVFQGLFSPAECQYIATVGNPWMQRAMIADPETGKGRLDPVRDSDTTAIPTVSEDLVIQQILATIAVASGTDVRKAEPLAILRYRPGQQYHPHFDAYDVGDPRPQRTHTALIWLNEGYEGGETRFPEIGVTVRGRGRRHAGVPQPDRRGLARRPHAPRRAAGEGINL